MKINPNRDLHAASPISRAAKKTARSAVAQTDFPNTANLSAQLAASPEVRADKVTRAKALIADSNYPDARIVRAVARQLADKIQPPPDSKSSS